MSKTNFTCTYLFHLKELRQVLRSINHMPTFIFVQEFILYIYINIYVLQVNNKW
jgi:hypothetical protein